MHRTRVFIACPGLERIQRGYESFFRGCFDALKDDPRLDITLYKGAGPREERERPLRSTAREGRAARLLGGFLGRSGYFAEQLTFFLSLLPRLLFRQPDVVYVSDVVLANFIRLLKRAPGCRYKVLFNNNGPVTPRLLHRWDHIQQVSPQYLNEALQVGVPPEKQTLLPSAVSILQDHRECTKQERLALKRELGLPTDRQIILSVGAIDGGRKRMDYLVEEVARLPSPRPFLVMLGQTTPDSARIIGLARRCLGPDGFAARTVRKEEVQDYYRASDVFALASLDEGFGLVYVEALANGLPCLVHDYLTSRYVLGDMGYYGDLSDRGTLSRMITALTHEDVTREKVISRHAYAYDRFSWDRMKPQYAEMFRRCAGLEP